VKSESLERRRVRIHHSEETYFAGRGFRNADVESRENGCPVWSEKSRTNTPQVPDRVPRTPRESGLVPWGWPTSGRIFPKGEPRSGRSSTEGGPDVERRKGDNREKVEEN